MNIKKERITMFVGVASLLLTGAIWAAIGVRNWRTSIQEGDRHHTIDLKGDVGGVFTNVYKVILLSKEHRIDERLCYGRLELVSVNQDGRTLFAYHDASGKRIEVFASPGCMIDLNEARAQTMRIFRSSTDNGWVLVEYLAWTSAPKE